MTGRDAVRSLRDSGAFDQRPPTPQWIKTALFGIAMLALAGAGFYVFTFVLGRTHGPSVSALPVNKDIPSFSDIDKKLQAANGAPLSGHITLQTSAPLTETESGRCTQLDIAAGKRAVAALHSRSDLPATPYDTLIEYVAGMGAHIVCEAATRPIHLCNPDGRQQLIWAVWGQNDNYRAIEEKLGSSDAPKATSEGLMGASQKQVAAFNAAFTDLLASARQKTDDALRKTVAQGVVPIAAYYDDVHAPSWRMNPIFASVSDVPSACTGRG